MLPINRDLPEELVIEILLRLPVKSLLRFKTLSKHHHSLIQSRTFINRHLDHVTTKTSHIEDQALILNENSIKEPDTIHETIILFNFRSGCTMPMDWLPSSYTLPMDWMPSSDYEDRYLCTRSSCLICGPVKGVYCLSLAFTEYEGFIHTIILWNPATREHHILPPFPLDDTNAGVLYDYFPKELVSMYCGFGFDTDTNEFKVLLIVYLCGCISDLFLYSLQNGKWSEIDGALDSDCNWQITDDWNSVYVHGACHWVCGVSNFISIVLTFDMSKEVFGSLSLPLELIEYESLGKTSVVADLNGYLALVNGQLMDEEGRSATYAVWVMKEYGVIESWQIHYCISLPMLVFGQFLGIVGEQIFVREDNGWLASYGLNSKGNNRYSIWDDRIKCILPYVETLVPFKSS